MTLIQSYDSRRTSLYSLRNGPERESEYVTSMVDGYKYVHDGASRGPGASVHRTERPRRRTHTVRLRAQSRFCCRSSASLMDVGSSGASS